MTDSHSKQVKDVPRELYFQCISHPKKKEFFKKYPIGISWTLTIEVLLRELIESNLTPIEKLHRIQDTYLFSIDQDDQLTKALTVDCWNQFFTSQGIDLSSLPTNLQESEFYHPKKLAESFGKKFSLDFFSKLNLALDISKMLEGKKNPDILEIGGGYGQLARVLSLLMPNSKYTVIDLPETLYYSYLFLRLNFPNAKITWITNENELNQALTQKDFDFLLVPCFFSEFFTKEKANYDVVINKSSFGEMNNKSSAYYIDLIQNRTSVKYAFFLNRFLNSVDPIVQTYRFNENQWYNNLDAYWDIKRWEVEPLFTMFPHNEILHHRELYFVAERSTVKEKVDDISDILISKWYANFTVVPFARHSNVLAIDLSKGGVLERLVNRVRIAPDETSVDALIKYIYLLEGKFPFEERFFYTNLYKKLTGRNHELSGYHPLLKYKLFAALLRFTGAAFILKSPKLPSLGISLLRKMRINVYWSYQTMKKLLFNEESKAAEKLD